MPPQICKTTMIDMSSFDLVSCSFALPSFLASILTANYHVDQIIRFNLGSEQYACACKLQALRLSSIRSKTSSRFHIISANMIYIMLALIMARVDSKLFAQASAASSSISMMLTMSSSTRSSRLSGRRRLLSCCLTLWIAV